MKNIPLANNVPPGQDEHFGGPNNGNDDDGIIVNNGKSQNINENKPNLVSENDDGSMEIYDDHDYDNAPEDNNKNNHYSEDEEDDDNNLDEPEDDDQDTNDIDQSDGLTGRERQRNKHSSHHSLPGGNGKLGPCWRTAIAHLCPILGATVTAEQAGVQMMKEYFEIEASKSTPQYRFRKGLKLFGDKGYQAVKDKLETNILERGCIDTLS